MNSFIDYIIENGRKNKKTELGETNLASGWENVERKLDLVLFPHGEMLRSVNSLPGKKKEMAQTGR